MCPDGLTLVAAVLMVIADLPAARHIGGFPGAASRWLCSVDSLLGRKEVYRTDRNHWQRRDITYLRAISEKARTASSDEQERMMTEVGSGYSELYRLEYYDPTKMLVIGPMHCLLEGAVHFHSRFLLRLNDIEGADGKLAYDFDWEEYSHEDCEPEHRVPAKHISDIYKLQLKLQRPFVHGKFGEEELRTRLMHFPKQVIKYVHHSLGLENMISITHNGNSYIVPTKTKDHFVSLLITWVRIFYRSIYS